MDESLLPPISALIRATPRPLVQMIAAKIQQLNWDQAEYAQQLLLAAIPQPALRDLVQRLVAGWQKNAPAVSPQALAFALLAAAQTSHDERAQQEITLVWTGPSVDGPALRQTEQALLQTIEQAQRSVLIVSFVVYDIPAIRRALIAAADRGVHLQLCIESPEASRGRLAYSALQALGSQVAHAATVYIWPYNRRAQNAQNQVGALHAKCAVADQQVLFISSANLTGHALSLNMELGVLIQGGSLPRSVWLHFQRLIEHGILMPIHPSAIP